MTLGDILNKLEKVKQLSKGQYEARCPAHPDRKPSLSIKAEDDRILMTCHTGCSVDAVCAALGITVADLFLTPKAQAPVKAHRPTPPSSQIVAEYSYTDEGGQELFQVVRLNPKSFRQRHRNGSNEWAWNLDGVRRVLYRLPEVVKSPALYFCEGEKDVDNLRAKGLTATTSPGGAQGWKVEYGLPLAGKDIILIPDMDGPGLDYARDVARALEGKVQLSVILLPKPAKDISDWLEAGGDVKALPSMVQGIEALFEEATSAGVEITARGQVYTYHWAAERVVMLVDRLSEERHIVSAEIEVRRGNIERSSRIGRARINLLSAPGRSGLVKYLSAQVPELAGAWPGMVQTACDETIDRYRAGDEAVELWTPELAPPRPEYLLWPLCPMGQPTLLFGEGDSGKSYFALLCYVVAQQRWPDNPLRLEIPPFPINGLYCDWETTESEVMGRLWRVKEGYSMGDMSLAYQPCGRRPLAGNIAGIQRAIIKYQADFMVVDSAAAACGGDINAPEPVEEFFGALRELHGYTQEHITTLILGHTSKDQFTKRKSPFGSVFWFNYSRQVIEAKRAEGKELNLALICRKANNARRFDPLGYSFRFEGDGVTVQAANAQDVLAAIPNGDEGASEQIVQALQGAGPSTITRLAHLTGLRDKTVEGTVSRLAEKGLLAQVGREGRAVLWGTTQIAASGESL